MPVDLPGGISTFLDGPDDQRLATPAIAGGKDSINTGGILTELSLEVGARIGLQAQLGNQSLLGTVRPDK